ncbi:MAG: hypothetical protein LBH35_00950 [Treponema sp.]|jgi:hypothetical protein|nr:hypothetical protein [Treponema sp.]
MICRKIRCKDYLADDGEPAWCYRAGTPAEVAVLKCPVEAAGINMKEKTVVKEGISKETTE